MSENSRILSALLPIEGEHIEDWHDRIAQMMGGDFTQHHDDESAEERSRRLLTYYHENPSAGWWYGGWCGSAYGRANF